MKNIIVLHNDSIVLDMDELFETKEYKRLIIKWHGGTHIVKEAESKFIQLSSEYNSETNTKIRFKKRKNISSGDRNKKYNELSPSNWRPKHICQYVKYKYKRRYGRLPLELDWDETGYKNARERSKNWAHAKHLIDKFERAKIPKRRLKEYINWCFANQNLPPTLPLLSCNAWIDNYIFKFFRGGQEIEEKKIKQMEQHWDETVRRLS